MQYLKRNAEYTIFAFLQIMLSRTISIFTFTKTKFSFFLFDNSQILLTTFQNPELRTININTASQDELIKVFKISKPLAQKIIAFPFMSFPRTRESIISSEELEGFKEPKDLLQIPELTKIDLREWEEEGIVFSL